MYCSSFLLDQINRRWIPALSFIAQGYGDKYLVYFFTAVKKLAIFALLPPLPAAFTTVFAGTGLPKDDGLAGCTVEEVGAALCPCTANFDIAVVALTVFLRTVCSAGSSMMITSFTELASILEATGTATAGIGTFSFAHARVLSRLRFAGSVGALALRKEGKLIWLSPTLVVRCSAGFTKLAEVALCEVPMRARLAFNDNVPDVALALIGTLELALDCIRE
jgi:hypothetical protein